MRQLARCSLPALAFTLAATGGLCGQSAADVFQQMLDAHVRHAEGVENYTLVQEVMGFETEMYFEKELVNDLPTFRLRQSKVGGRVIGQPDEDDAGWERLYQLIPELTHRAEYVGRGETHGFPVHVVEVRDLHELEFSPIPDSDRGDFIPERMKLHVDADQWIVRWAEIAGTMTAEGEQHDFTAATDLTDYREVDGMLHPFLVTMTVSGIGEAMGMDDDEMAEMRAQLEEMKKQMEEMPEAQRKMMEQMMGERMSGLEEMLQGTGEGAMTIEIKVKDLRVNAGPPTGE